MIYHALFAAGLIAVAIPTAMSERERACASTFDVRGAGAPQAAPGVCRASTHPGNARCRLGAQAGVATLFAASKAGDCLVASRSAFGDGAARTTR